MFTADTPVLSHTIYLDRDPAIIEPASVDNAGNNESTLVPGEVTTPGWPVDAETWKHTVDCVTRTFAPFDVSVVTQRPTSGHYIEAVIGGYPSAIDADQHYTGLAPMDPQCGVIEDSLVFVFAAKLMDDPQDTCAVIAQEVAHSYGLDHELLASDPMSYLPYDHERSFQDSLVACGEFEPRPCGPQGFTCSEKQNSMQMLAQRVGLRGGYRLGTATITAPVDQAIVPQSFEIDAVETTTFAEATGAHLWIDNQQGDYQAGIGPYKFHSPDLANGNHEIAIVVDDAAGQHVETSIEITVDEQAHDADALGCNAGGRGAGWGAVLVAFVLCRRRCSRASNAATSARSRIR